MNGEISPLKTLAGQGGQQYVRTVKQEHVSIISDIYGPAHLQCVVANTRWAP